MGVPPGLLAPPSPWRSQCDGRDALLCLGNWDASKAHAALKVELWDPWACVCAVDACCSEEHSLPGSAAPTFPFCLQRRRVGSFLSGGGEWEGVPITHQK